VTLAIEKWPQFGCCDVFPQELSTAQELCPFPFMENDFLFVAWGLWTAQSVHAACVHSELHDEMLCKSLSVVLR
jgi:hypothetical protein